MAQPQLLQDNFTRMIQDLPRDQLPDDAAWAIYDYIPNVGRSSGANIGGRLAKRGGWIYATDDISGTASSAASITAAGYFESVSRFCVTTDNNKFCYFPANSTAWTQVSTSSIQSVQNYVEIGGTLIIPNNDGTTTPKSYDGTTFQNLAGTPPTAKYAAVWKDRLVLGSTSALPNRSYFSGLDDPTTWDTTNGWVDTIHNIRGYAALPNALLIFGADVTARIRGSIPPPGTDFIIDDPIFRVGCTFPKSIATNGPLAIFANEEGVWITNGTSQVQDLTAMCGVKNTWQTITTSNRVGAGGIGATVSDVTGGFIGNYYLVTTTRIEGEPPRAFLFNLADRSCVILTNFASTTSVMTPQVGDELYTAIGKYVAAVSPIFEMGASANKADGNGTAIAPSLYTRYYTDTKTGDKRWKMVYLDFECVDAASDNPTLTVSYHPSSRADESGYTTAGTLSETTSGDPIVRKKLHLTTGNKAPGMSFKIAQSNNSLHTVINGLSADVHALEGGRVG